MCYGTITQFAGAKLLLFSELTKFFAIKYLLSTNFVLFLPCFFRLGCRYRIKNVIRNSYIIPVPPQSQKKTNCLKKWAFAYKL
jgi:hypothetical protein